MDLGKEFLQRDVLKTFMTLVNNVLLFFFRKWISHITVWQKWRICQPFHLLVNWIWDVSLLTDIYIHPCARELTHTFFAFASFSILFSNPYCFFLCFYMIMSTEIYLTKVLHSNATFPCVLLLTCPLSDNSFSEISGLEQCCNLTHLNLEHNRISRISGLNGLPLIHLCLVGPPPLLLSEIWYTECTFTHKHSYIQYIQAHSYKHEFLNRIVLSRCLAVLPFICMPLLQRGLFPTHTQ